jgi:hypothetical protein
MNTSSYTLIVSAAEKLLRLCEFIQGPWPVIAD